MIIINTMNNIFFNIIIIIINSLSWYIFLVWIHGCCITSNAFRIFMGMDSLDKLCEPVHPWNSELLHRSRLVYCKVWSTVQYECRLKVAGLFYRIYTGGRVYQVKV